MPLLKKIFVFVTETGKTVVVSLAVVLLIRMFLVQPFYVKGASMEPNFNDGQYLIINEIGYRFEEPKRGDVVVFRYPLNPSEYFIKRIVGLPGETVAVDDGRVFINKKELAEAYLPKGLTTYGKITLTLSGDEYFVLGDNRPASHDSRRWGVLRRNFIVGKAWLRGWPLNKAGVISQPVYTTQ